MFALYVTETGETLPLMISQVLDVQEIHTACLFSLHCSFPCELTPDTVVPVNSTVFS